jgi:SWI/SNF-related matrix-associated actin-dependent regulator of chromatin subfamily A-like protein 1
MESNMPRISYTNGQYVFTGDYKDKDLPKNARWRWNPSGRYWWTDDDRKAATLAMYADASCKERLHSYVAKAAAAIDASRATDADVALPVPQGLEYLPYQRAGIAYAVQRENALIADEMGLGKTIQAIGVANATDAKHILIICPASLRLNWERELKKWLVTPRKIGVVVANDWPPNCDVYVVNFDIVDRHRDKIDAIEWDLLVIDEAHYLKNEKARRTCAVLGGSITKVRKSKAA